MDVRIRPVDRRGKACRARGDDDAGARVQQLGPPRRQIDAERIADARLYDSTQFHNFAGRSIAAIDDGQRMLRRRADVAMNRAAMNTGALD